jgi:hypothetical protein
MVLGERYKLLKGAPVEPNEIPVDPGMIDSFTIPPNDPVGPVDPDPPPPEELEP